MQRCLVAEEKSNGVVPGTGGEFHLFEGLAFYLRKLYYTPVASGQLLSVVKEKSKKKEEDERQI
jgi:hypothetical protein